MGKIELRGPIADLNICESVYGNWHYHLREGTTSKALCGATVMPTLIPIDRWNKPIPDYHLPESFCEDCEKKRLGATSSASGQKQLSKKENA